MAPGTDPRERLSRLPNGSAPLRVQAAPPIPTDRRIIPTGAKRSLVALGSSSLPGPASATPGRRDGNDKSDWSPPCIAGGLIVRSGWCRIRRWPRRSSYNISEAEAGTAHRQARHSDITGPRSEPRCRLQRAIWNRCRTAAPLRFAHPPGTPGRRLARTTPQGAGPFPRARALSSRLKRVRISIRGPARTGDPRTAPDPRETLMHPPFMTAGTLTGQTIQGLARQAHPVCRP